MGFGARAGNAWVFFFQDPRFRVAPSSILGLCRAGTEVELAICK